jgi:hypothetical protein
VSFVITRREIPTRIAEPFGVMLVGDCHIGAVNVDYAFLKTELREAAERGDRINVNGDVFDAILPKDHKRFRPDVLHPHLHGRADVLDAACEMAMDVFGPVAKSIDMMGQGNHETSVIKYHSVDPISWLVRDLNRNGGKVQHGSYTGFIDYRLRHGTGRTRVGGSTHCARVIIYYHHGAGGSAPVTKGMIDFNRKTTWVDSHVIWLGHKHNRIADATSLRVRCPQKGDGPILDPQLSVMSGGYMDIYAPGIESYAAESGMAPQKKGGARLLVKMHHQGGIENIQVVM